MKLAKFTLGLPVPILQSDEIKRAIEHWHQTYPLLALNSKRSRKRQLDYVVTSMDKPESIINNDISFSLFFYQNRLYFIASFCV